ncbi:MAG: EAL domain-containing protein [Ketobacteraceae bacterium]|nr:EAL domain-containing protein [Ketobacteraceae bacterium]
MNEPEYSLKEGLKILIVDDSEDDVYLLTHTLKKSISSFHCRHVETIPELQTALNDSWHVVITDHHMSGFSSLEVLDAVRDSNPDLPVVIVSGEIGEDVAVGEMHRGARDYIMKDNLARLAPVVLREYRQYQSRKAHKKTEENYRFLRYHDNLTNLVNRKEFENSIGKALAEVKRSRKTHVLMFLDLDQFKVVNDTCGHIAGDELLVRTTNILKACIRERDTLARLGGDEFGILLDNCHKDGAFKVAKTIRRKVQENRFIWEGKPFEVTISLGMVEINEHARDIHELLSCADIACYAAKDKGRDGMVWFTPDDVEYNKRRSEMQWAPRIRQAAEEDLFVLYHQPMANLANLPGTNTEFLLRMSSPEGLIGPGEFIPAAERYNLMPVIDRWVVKHVFEYLNTAGLGHQADGTYFINLSGSTLSDRSFFEDIKRLQKLNLINPQSICFEITETAAIDNLVDAVGFIGEIRQHGYKFALDDFGVGLSSFSYLKTIPVDYLKIDGSFVRNMLEDSIDRGIVEACNKIAHAAGLLTVAEFVENSKTLELLRQIGVDYAQGYGIKKPGPLLIDPL